MKGTFVLVAVLLALPCFAQAPAMSYDGQKFPVSVDECMRMATLTLEREGYQVGSSADNGIYGSRDIHRALIICRAAPDGTWANVVVSSNAQENTVAGSETRLIMSHMAEAVRYPRFDPDRDSRDRDRDSNRGRDRERARDPRGTWIIMTSQQPLPSNAIAGGTEPNHPVPQYVCRAEQEGNSVPGKTVTSGGSTDCLIPYRNTEIRTNTYDLLTGDPDDFVWGIPDPGRPPFYTGREGNVQLRSCRFELRVRGDNKGRHLGKEAGGKCFVSYKGVAYPSDRYEVLYRNN